MNNTDYFNQQSKTTILLNNELDNAKEGLLAMSDHRNLTPTEKVVKALTHVPVIDTWATNQMQKFNQRAASNKGLQNKVEYIFRTIEDHKQTVQDFYIEGSKIVRDLEKEKSDLEIDLVKTEELKETFKGIDAKKYTKVLEKQSRQLVKLQTLTTDLEFGFKPALDSAEVAITISSEQLPMLKQSLQNKVFVLGQLQATRKQLASVQGIKDLADKVQEESMTELENVLQDIHQQKINILDTSKTEIRLERYRQLSRRNEINEQEYIQLLEKSSASTKKILKDLQTKQKLIELKKDV